jgi:hypothetical protein
MSDISVPHLLFESSFGAQCICLDQTKHGILLCKVSALSLCKQSMDQINFPVHMAVLIMYSS